MVKTSVRLMQGDVFRLKLLFHDVNETASEKKLLQLPYAMTYAKDLGLRKWWSSQEHFTKRERISFFWIQNRLNFYF